MAKFVEVDNIRPGDTLVATQFLQCLPVGEEVTVEEDDKGRLFVFCNGESLWLNDIDGTGKAKHFLKDHELSLVSGKPVVYGFSKKEENATNTVNDTAAIAELTDKNHRLRERIRELKTENDNLRYDQKQLKKDYMRAVEGRDKLLKKLRFIRYVTADFQNV